MDYAHLVHLKLELSSDYVLISASLNSPEVHKERSNRRFPDDLTDLFRDPAQLLSEKIAVKLKTLTQAQIECVLTSFNRHLNSGGNGPAYCGVVVTGSIRILGTQCA